MCEQDQSPNEMLSVEGNSLRTGMSVLRDLRLPLRLSGSTERLGWNLHWLAIIVGLLSLVPASPAFGALVSDIDTSYWQLFLDDFVVARGTGLDRVVHQPRALGLVIPADKPWETFGCYPQYVGRRQDGTFFAFYHAFWWDTTPQFKVEHDRAHDFKDTMAYATSKDGIHWEKPNLKLVEAPAGIDWQKFPPFPSPKGTSKDNNLIVFSGNPLAQSGFSIWDLGAHGNMSDPAKRFAIFYQDRGYFASELPDFLNDAKWAEKLVPCGGRFSPRAKGLHFWDNLHDEWVTIVQNAVPHWLPSREVARFASKDLNGWRSEIVLTPDSNDPHKPGYFDEPMSMLPFCAEGVVLGMLSWFHSDRTNPDGGPVLQKSAEHPYIWPWARKGVNEMRIAISRDGGRTWDRTSSREAWIPHGKKEDDNDRLVIGPCPPIRVGEEDWFYIDVIDGNHLVIRNSPDQMPYYSDRVVKHQIALYTQKRNRYVSLRAGNQKTVLITKPLTLSGTVLQLNVDASRGQVRVGIASAEPVATLGGSTLSTAPHLAEERPLSGFKFDDCTPVRANSIEHHVQFKNGTSLKNLSGKQVRLLFEMVDADLYAFRVQ
jgi:hypothetical protein